MANLELADTPQVQSLRIDDPQQQPGVTLWICSTYDATQPDPADAGAKLRVSVAEVQLYARS